MFVPASTSLYRFETKVGRTARAVHALGGGAHGRSSSWTRSARALLIQDMQNDVIIEGGAFADSGSPQHAKEQNVVENVGEARGRVPRARACP